MQPSLDTLFEGFDGREQALRAVTRYSLYDVMFYRTNLWNHSRRVMWLVREMTPYVSQVFGDSFDAQKALLMALVHDDAELITGDVQAGNKVRMTLAQLAEIDRNKTAAIEAVSSRFPVTVGGYSYSGLLTEALRKDTLESRIMTLADKLDGFGEALHELYAGNPCMTAHVTNEYGTPPLPHEYYLDYFAKLGSRYPELGRLSELPFWAFKQPFDPGFMEACATGKPHTPNSLRQPTGYAHYDEWKQVTFKYGLPPEKAELHTQTEFLLGN